MLMILILLDALRYVLPDGFAGFDLVPVRVL